ncbi:MAG: hypothetical protein QOD26_2092 [Betaproteobacteria bacterium]|nr:hypothetical protein [Betaproteobacteria bacterium]
MKTLLIVAVLELSLAACSGGPGRTPADGEVSSGVVERAQQVELLSPAETDRQDGEEDLDDARFATQLVVRLNDGRTVTIVYSGPRHFEAGQRVRVHADEKAAFVL